MTPPDLHEFRSLGVSVDIVKSSAESADIVIAEVNPRMPRTLGDSFIHVGQIDVLTENDYGGMDSVGTDARLRRKTNGDLGFF